MSEKISIPAVSDESRLGFNLRTFCEEHGLDASNGGAAHMWREEWDETVSDIYKHTISTSDSCLWRLPFLNLFLRTTGTSFRTAPTCRPLCGCQGAQEVCEVNGRKPVPLSGHLVQLFIYQKLKLFNSIFSPKGTNIISL